MEYRRIGTTGLEVSELGVGCSSWWAKSAFPEDEALSLIHTAIEQGVTFFDTGPSYAAGQAEKRLGKALQAHQDARLVIGTKAGSNGCCGRQRPSGLQPVGGSKERGV